MNPQEHCEDCCATAALYALGALPRDEARQFEQRLASGCPLCSAAVAESIEATELLAMSVTPRTPPPQLRDRLLERIAATPRPSTPVNPDLTLIRSDASPWRPSGHPGVEVRPLLGHKTLLVRMQPGTVLPTHEHDLAEQCYVLEGSVTDSDGVTAYAGDFVCMAAGSTHQPIHTDTGCLFLIAYA